MTVAYIPDDYEPMSARRRQRCMSCGELIDVGATAARVLRVRIPESDIECRIYGEDGEIPITHKWLCERCADLYFSLGDLGYCVVGFRNARLRRGSIVHHMVFRGMYREGLHHNWDRR